ncbi:hypothetical protein [Cupriavidus sp. UYPR2.512]|uniref:hypothetical protein n=1 Tax=Cupriavidus sp. UYPR2.512 TaxID=1080187 RepID=UPI0018DF0D80|nr:hypothetical protein [Cupriavidus sp. UYPR2.512]UIF88539.1 hypothetical protein KAF44_24680 [Cupriavidus necator]
MTALGTAGSIVGAASEASAAALASAKATMLMSLTGALANTMKTAGQTIQGATGH